MNVNLKEKGNPPHGWIRQENKKALKGKETLLMDGCQTTLPACLHKDKKNRLQKTIHLSVGLYSMCPSSFFYKCSSPNHDGRLTTMKVSHLIYSLLICYPSGLKSRY